jgi:hypothetical protein
MRVRWLRVYNELVTIQHSYLDSHNFQLWNAINATQKFE